MKERRTNPDLDWWEILRSIKRPTVVLRGAESTVLDRDVAGRMGRELPDGRFVEIPKAVSVSDINLHGPVAHPAT